MDEKVEFPEGLSVKEEEKLVEAFRDNRVGRDTQNNKNEVEDLMKKIKSVEFIEKAMAKKIDRLKNEDEEKTKEFDNFKAKKEEVKKEIQKLKEEIIKEKENNIKNRSITNSYEKLQKISNSIIVKEKELEDLKRYENNITKELNEIFNELLDIHDQLLINKNPELN
ncbi:hypothetical protein A3I25_00215 [Candidatus Nomurabacteria bacterium RIFCSPLOWO2_02_FULL_42_17]|uniref:Uncharacterized protein n=2 Tax=Candidatus Nomuraibacteriota TaxID=1752729 RepID=A0A1F6WHG8_9BACT|nr:MAG: Exonuclease SbcC [Parcubacteria group bacterium GW2011_GWA2_42_18]OGI81348.1 MAG: hypothetical protein A3B93_01180 [Candidatus Nomurabacteria bacterium RIFCSPHIGHO2_02_FULL_42_24]OGI97674.1 MAG: hypothetical protein A3I25_00215 [Candidatus Nomurabacteria bacterium RIFCSPLOWO2_02_FULL_42_17]